MKWLYFLLLLSSCFSDGPVSKEKAIQVAEEELVRSYGEDILKQRPFKISLQNDIWIIEGTLKCSEKVTSAPEGFVDICLGGVGYVEVSRKSGKILKITHSK